MNSHRVLLVGMGNLGSLIFDLLVRVPGHHTFLVGGRNLDYLRQRANLSLLAAIQLGYTPDVTCTLLDAENIEQTAETIARFRPTIILCAAVLQPLDATRMLPEQITRQLAVAPMGPRLPFYLLLIYRLMQALHLAKQQAIVLNAIYPDVVHPILSKVGLAPTTGIGDLANNIPAIRLAVAWKLGKPLEQIGVRLVAARYVSYWMSRIDIGNAPFHLTIFVNGKDQSHLLDQKTLFEMLPGTLKRVGGTTGLLMTATSAAAVYTAIMENTGKIEHAPGPNGLPGGYPVRIDSQGVQLALPKGLSREAAIRLNQAGLERDGIECIEEDGTVCFTEEAVAIYKSLLGYECQRMPLHEVEYWARDLADRYQAVAHDTKNLH